MPTDDGATLFLHHHPGVGLPVLVVHGISSNHHCWDLEPGRSVADHLVQEGFDPWLLDLRGHGQARSAPGGKRLEREWDIDSYALHDLPAAIAFVREQTGAERVGYVGHSLGGMVGAIYASQIGDDFLESLVAVGSPVDFRDPDPLFELMERSFYWGGSLLPSIQTPQMAWALDALPGFLPREIESLLYNPRNMEDSAARRMMNAVVSPLWAGEMRQFARILREERFLSSDGKIDYLAELPKIHVPTLVIAGRADRVAPPDRVRPYADGVGSERKSFVLAGRENGFSEDYGHLDLCIGDHAEREIYPLISSWLGVAR